MVSLVATPLEPTLTGYPMLAPAYVGLSRRGEAPQKICLFLFPAITTGSSVLTQMDCRTDTSTSRLSTGNPGERSERSAVCHSLTLLPRGHNGPTLCRPDRSVAKWRDLQCLPLSNTSRSEHPSPSKASFLSGTTPPMLEGVRENREARLNPHLQGQFACILQCFRPQ